MFVHHSATIGKVDRCSNIIMPLYGRLLDVRVSYPTFIGKVVNCSCIITPLCERLLDVRAS
jgi:hypothetical protein